MSLARGWLGVGLIAVLEAAAGEPAYSVIVNAANPVTEMKKSQVAALFLDRGARWAATAAAPVDQSARSGLREAFSREVLGKSVVAVVNHWRQRMGSPVDRQIPPPVKVSDEEVVAYVAKDKGGIGYVSSAAVLPATVKVLRLRD